MGEIMRRRGLVIALGFAMAWPIAANGQPDVRALRSQILLMQAEGIADKLAQFIKENQNQAGWTTQIPSTGSSIEQRRFDALRLLRQAPAITELSLLDDQEDLLRAGLFAPRVGALYDFGTRRYAVRRWRERRRTQSQPNLGNCASDQGRQSRRRLCC